jgi:putative ABC transport system substrate-binding protein
MKRGDILAMLGALAFAGAVPAHAQKLAVPVVGFLGSSSAAQWAPFVAASRNGLDETGFVEGKNVAVDFRWAEGQYDRLPALAAELVQRRVAVIVATGGAPSGLAAKAATSTIPIVFTTGGDAVAQGLIPSLGRPGGNVTGVSFFTAELVVKRLELLHELLPKATEIALIVNPRGPTAESQLRIAKQPPRSFGQQVRVLNASSTPEVDAVFATFAHHCPDAIIVGTDLRQDGSCSDEIRVCVVNKAFFTRRRYLRTAAS